LDRRSIVVGADGASPVLSALLRGARGSAGRVEASP
jgi:hypothetical protein